MFSDILKQLRKRKHMSQIELSTTLGISRSAISMYESGERMPDYEMMKKNIRNSVKNCKKVKIQQKQDNREEEIYAKTAILL